MSSLYTKNKEKQPNKVKTWWGGLPKKNKIIAITATSALVAGIIAGGVAISIANSQKTYAPQDVISAMLTIDGVKPASIMVAPATETWWKTLLSSNPNTSLSTLKFADVSSGAEYISTSMSKGKKYQNTSTVGVPTTFIVYDTPANAEAAYQKLVASTMNDPAEVIDTTDKLSPVVAGNFLLFIPEGSFSDVDYALEAYKNVTSDNAKMKVLSNKQATWTLDFSDFDTILNSNSTKENKKVYTELVSKLGIGKDTTWSGTSSDGLVWNGIFSNYKADTVATPSAISEYLGSLVVPLYEIPTGKDAPTETGYEVPIKDVNQAIIGSCCMIVSNTDSTMGANADGAKVITGKALGDKGFLEVTIIPNSWMGLLTQRTSYSFTGYKSIDILVKDKNGSSTITLVPFVK